MVSHIFFRRVLFRSLSSFSIVQAARQQNHAPFFKYNHEETLNRAVSLRPLATYAKRPSLASRAAEFPEIIRQWHPHKNTVGPESVTPFSHKKVWFVCDEG
eukprot:Colp12_sorted_trinity150504_noHs@6517